MQKDGSTEYDVDDKINRLLNLLSPPGAIRQPPQWIHAAADMSRSNAMLHKALSAVSDSLVGRTTGTQTLEDRGSREYVAVLQYVREEINSNSQCTSLPLLFTVILLATFEVYSPCSSFCHFGCFTLANPRVVVISWKAAQLYPFSLGSLAFDSQAPRPSFACFWPRSYPVRRHSGLLGMRDPC